MTAEWRPDPEGRFEYRWWDGAGWADQVAHQGQVGVVPLGGGGPAEGDQPPQDAQQAHDAQQVQPVQPAQDAWASQQAQPVGGYAQQGGADGFAGISGDLVDGRYSEREAAPIANQNNKMLRVRVGQPFMARQGAMVAYQGDVQFAFQGGGAAKFLKKALTGEGLPLMQVTGQGDVFLAEKAYDVHMLQLTNSGLSVSGKNVLAFSTSLDWNIERVKGGSIAAGGLFNTTLRGTGWVAITTDGPPVVLNAAEAPTFADTQAIVAWSANLQTQLKTSFSAGALIGRGSGEAFQVAFHGQGFVIVQPSEGIQIPTSQ
ncbi:MAG TPA: AIM24 family protein [Euzebya sp.]|nr:AIM24 family protein [Euzebya sp.]